MKRLLFVVVLYSLFFPFAASAAVDLRCFTETDCIDRRKDILGENNPEATKNPLYFGTDAEKACGATRKNGALYNNSNQKVGFCYPSSRAETRISFAGKKSFDNIGEFIQFGYRFAIIAASVIAVIMIIIAGFEWTASAGSADRIKSAQKRITGAVMGLILAVLSYFILNTINPYLVNFRLPQAWMINSIAYQVEFCYEMASDTFAYIGTQYEKAEPNGYTNAKFSLAYNEKQFACGNQYFYQSGKGNICRGDYCVAQGGQTQSCIHELTDKTKYTCSSGDISGWITNTQADTPFWKDWEEDADVVDDFEPHVVCADGTTVELDSDEEFQYEKDDKYAKYNLFVTEVATAADAKLLCPGNNALGLILFPDIDENLDFKDEAHYIGMNPDSPTEGVDLGDKNTKFFEQLKSNTPIKGHEPSKYLLPLDALDAGKQLNIDVGNIKDVD